MPAALGVHIREAEGVNRWVGKQEQHIAVVPLMRPGRCRIPASCVDLWPHRVALPTHQVGAVLVSMNPAYQTTELEYAVARCGMTHLIMSPGWRASDYVGMLQVNCSLGAHKLG